MKAGLRNAIGLSFILFTLLFFFVYGPIARRADHDDAVLLSLSGDLNAQEQILKLEPQIAATQKALIERRSALIAKCMPHCSAVQTNASEIAALRAIAKGSGLNLTGRDFNSDGTIHTASVGSLGASLRDLDAFSRLPIPVQIVSVSLTAQGNKVKMDVNGTKIQGGM